MEDLLAGQLPFLHHGPGSTGIATSHHSFVLQADLWEGISSPHLQVRQLQTLLTRQGVVSPCCLTCLLSADHASVHGRGMLHDHICVQPPASCTGQQPCSMTRSSMTARHVGMRR